MRDERGFTLAELLVVVAVLGLVVGGGLQLFLSGQQAWVAGTARLEAQQGLRAAMDRIMTDIRGAGVNPVAPGCGTAITNTSTRGFTLNNDLNGNGRCTDAGEQTRWVVVGRDLVRFADLNPGEVVASNIERWQFVYRDALNRTPPLGTTLQIDVTLSARGGPRRPPAPAPQAPLVSVRDSARLRNREQ